MGMLVSSTLHHLSVVWHMAPFTKASSGRRYRRDGSFFALAADDLLAAVVGSRASQFVTARSARWLRQRDAEHVAASRVIEPGAR
jgi:hypothetical protein